MFGYWQPVTSFFFHQYLIFLQVSSFGTGGVWTANCSFKAFFNQEFHILLQALRKKQTDKYNIDPVQYPVSQLDEKKRKTNRPRTRKVGKQTLACESLLIAISVCRLSKYRQENVVLSLLKSLRLKAALIHIFILITE